MRPGINPKVLGDILDERARQDAQWGGPEHDDTHGGQDWVEYIVKQAGESLINLDNFRQCMVKIAALACAAIESYDRIPERYAEAAAEDRAEHERRRAKHRAEWSAMDPFERRYGEAPPADR